MDRKQEQVLHQWIKANVVPAKNWARHSWGLKYAFAASEEGFHVTNGEFKLAMRECGYRNLNERYYRATVKKS